MSSNDNFEKQLEIGTIGEDLIHSYLISNNSYVQDLRKQKHENKFGPRLCGTEGTLTLPDFVVYNKNPEKGNFAVDVKVKSSVYTINDKLCFTVDSKYEQYLRVKDIMKLDFLIISFVYENRNYFYRDSECIGTHIFKNKYSKGSVYLFEFDKSKIRY